VTYWAGEPVQIDLAVAHGEGQAIADAMLLWQVTPGTEAGQLTLSYIAPGQVWQGGDVTFTAPEVTTPTALRLALELRASDGRVLATNYLELTVFPRWEGPFAGNGRLWTPDEKLAERLAVLGYQLTSEQQAADAVVVNKLDEAVITYIREGGRLLLLAEEATAIEAEHLGIRLMARNGSVWSGDWASSFTWIRRRGPFARLPGGPLIDHSFDCVIPEHVMLGFNAWDFKAHVHSGLFVGWIHQPVALIAEKRYGKGRAVLTTFRLTGDAPGADPMATTLLHTLVELTLAR
jgi:hypothetical protein